MVDFDIEWISWKLNLWSLAPSTIICGTEIEALGAAGLSHFTFWQQGFWQQGSATLPSMSP